MKLLAVIGASYGDEGKGHTVNYLADNKTLVVRFNGGAQAGHTVRRPDGRQHVFHHIGSGTLKGAHTFLAKHFVANPMLFSVERQNLAEATVFIDPECRITTPWDMMLNQEVELQRKHAKHGSCGVGFNETITRCEHPEFSLKYKDLHPRVTPKVQKILDEIENVWVPLRVEELGLDMERLQTLSEYRFHQGVRKGFTEDCQYLLDYTSPREWSKDIPYSQVVFEGAQGLRLDELGEDFPHVTRSRTGITNVLELLRDAEWVEWLDVIYVTRPYLTKHGAGPLKYELSVPPYQGVTDPTNPPNVHQGTIRYAWLDMAVLAKNIKADFSQLERGWPDPRVALTCLEHVPDKFSVVIDGRVQEVNKEEFVAFLEQHTPIRGSITAFPPLGNSF